MYRGSHSDWTSASLKKEAAPKQGELLATQAVNVGQGDAISLPLPSQMAVNGVHTLIVMLDEGGNDIWFRAIEAGSGPELLITVCTSFPEASPCCSMAFE